MKKKRNFAAKLLVMAACMLPTLAFGQLPTSGQWKSKTITGTQTVNLTGDVTINGEITIGKGGSLTINNSTAEEVTIRRTGNTRMFRVLYGGTLTINGNDGGKIVIHGGANLEWDNSQWEAQKKKSWTDCKYTASEYKYKPLKPKTNPFISTTAMIRTNGNLELNHVRVEQFDARNNVAHAIHIEDDSSGTGQCGSTKLTNCVIRWCRAQLGSAIYVGFQDQYKNNDNEKCAVTLENVDITECMVNPNADDNQYWGGVIRTRGRSVSNLNMINCTMTKNYSTGNGSCVLWNAGGIDNKIKPKLTFNNCRFTDNRADQDGGALRLESSYDFEGVPTIFEKNYCGQYGGAIVVVDYEAPGDLVDAKNFDYNLNEKMVIKDNYAGQGGGGIAFVFSKNELKDGFTFNINLNGLTVSENEAGERGGGILFANIRKGTDKTYYFNVYLNSGTISNNTALKAGGGIFARGMTIETNTSGQKVTISNNKVTAASAVAGEDGAKGGGGGINLYDGTMTLNTCEITGNIVTGADGMTDLTNGYGGGIMLNRSNFTLNGTNNISGNQSNVGGGVAVINETTAKKTVNLTSGDVNGNTANLCGGGVAVVGNVTMTVSGVNIKENTALNAGGIYMRGRTTNNNEIAGANATMTYTGGQITGNKANKKEGDPDLINTTAYHATTDKITGIGGGICVGANATLALLIKGGEQLGIQGNIAANGADDVFCNGASGSKVVLPNVSRMTIAGRDQLFWVEDYITNDTEYQKGTAVNSNWNNNNIRYRYALDNNRMSEVFRLSQKSDYTFAKPYNGSEAIYEEFNDKYMCLTLGSVSTYIILRKTGMEARDNAIFKIYRWNINETPDGTKPTNLETDKKYLYMTMILTDRDKDNDVRRKNIVAEYGYYYYIKETPWSWAYNSTCDPIDGMRKIDRNATNEADRTFTFINTPKENVPKHAESVKINEMPGKK